MSQVSESPRLVGEEFGVASCWAKTSYFLPLTFYLKNTSREGLQSADCGKNGIMMAFFRGGVKHIPIDKTKRCKAIVSRKGQMFHVDGTEAEVGAIIRAPLFVSRQGHI